MTHHEAAKGLPSASQFDALFRCPGKWEMEKRFPHDETSSSDAARGQRIHEALQRSDLSGLSGSEELTASICMDIEAQLADEYDFHGEKEVIWEKRYWDVDDHFNQLWSAQLDYVAIAPPRALVIDDKTGWGIPMPIEGNWQIAAQAGLMWFHHGVREVIAALAHPHHPSSRQEVKLFDARKCAESMVTIRGWVELIQTPDQPRIPSTFNCQYCRAKHACPERMEWLNRTAKNIKDEVNEQGYTSLLDRTPLERGEHYRALKELQGDTKIVMGRYVDMAVKDEGSVAGWRPTKKWDRYVTDEDAALELIEQAYGEKTAARSMIFSLAECEKVIAKQKGISLVKAREELEVLLKELLKWKPSEPWLIEQRNF